MRVYFMPLAKLTLQTLHGTFTNYLNTYFFVKTDENIKENREKG